MNDDRTLLESSWKSRPLCSKYSVLVFMPAGTSLRNADDTDRPTIWWGLGVVNDGQSEVLGYWSPAVSEANFWSDLGGHLSHRGVVGVDVALVTGTNETDVTHIGWSTSTPGRAPRVEANDLVPPARLQQRKLRAIGVARNLQKTLSGAIRRHGPFACTASAGDFVARQLQRLDKQLWSYGRDPAQNSRTAPTRPTSQLSA